MRPLALSSPLLVLLLAAGAAAQQTVFHFDGTAEFASRGTAATTDNNLVMQRLPADQIGTATSVAQIVVLLQDQNYTTSETTTFHFRKNDPANPGFFDKSAAGLIATAGPFTLTFPMPTSGVISAAQLTVTLTGGLPLPAGVADGASPGADLYVGHELLGKPSTADILLGQASGTAAICGGANPPTTGEQMDLAQAGYNGVVGAAAMAQQANLTTGTAVSLNSGNRSWRIQTRFDDDVMQTFASNAAVFSGQIPCPAPGVGGGTGLNPNFGYAGIFPDLARGDGVGVRHRVAAPVGTTSLLFVSFGTVAPYGVYPATGKFMLDPASILYVAAVATAAAPATEPATVSDATYGPAPLAAALSGLVINMQGVKNVGGVYQISTMATLKL